MNPLDPGIWRFVGGYGCLSVGCIPLRHFRRRGIYIILFPSFSPKLMLGQRAFIATGLLSLFHGVFLPVLDTFRKLKISASGAIPLFLSRKKYPVTGTGAITCCSHPQQQRVVPHSLLLPRNQAQPAVPAKKKKGMFCFYAHSKGKSHCEKGCTQLFDFCIQSGGASS